MGQKTHPIGLRLGINRTWDSLWFDERKYAEVLHEDLLLKKILYDRLKQASVSRIVIERLNKCPRITVYSARPGVVIGKKGSDIEKLKEELSKKIGVDVGFNVVEVRKPELDAKLVAEGIAHQLERRVSFRRAMKKAVQSALKMGAKGIRISCAGRLGGAEIARTEQYREGRVPLHTLRADIDFGYGSAKTTYGICGVKVWIYTGDIMEHNPQARNKKFQETAAGHR